MALNSAARGSLRLLAQLTAVALVVAVPWLINFRLHEDVALAHQWWAHSGAVIGKVNEIRSEVRDADRALLWQALYPDDTSLLDHHRASRARALAAAGELVELAADNPGQAGRAAQLQVLIETRIVESDRVIALLAQNQLDIVRELFSETGVFRHVRGVGNELIAEEQALLARRQEDAERRQRRYLWAMFGFAALQVLLLTLIVVVSERQHARRRRLETEADQLRARSDLIFNSVRKPIALLDGDLHLAMCNPAFRQLYDIADGEDVRGLPLTAVGGGAWNEAGVLQRLGDVVRFGRELWDYEVEQDLAGGKRWLQIAARRVPLVEGGTLSVILTGNDITAVRGAERQIRELNRQLNDRVDQVSAVNRELEGFTYSVSHDLRAPLRHIAAFGMKLERELRDEASASAAHYLRVIGESAQRMGVLIDELLVHSRLGRGTLRHQPVAMDELVREVVAMLGPDTAGRRIEWQIGELPAVPGDPTTLRLVWQNLIGNAVKYTAQRDPAQIAIDGHLDGERDEIVYRVADNGAGFDMAYADKLFGVFQRLHPADQFPGTGIGLANVRRIVVHHGGRVWAEAQPDRGAVFFFALPARPPALTPTTEAAA